MGVGLVEICLDVELHYGTRVMLRDKPYLVPELQRVMVFREGVPVEGHSCSALMSNVFCECACQHCAIKVSRIRVGYVSHVYLFINNNYCCGRVILALL